MIKSMPLNEFLFEYTERNIDNKYRPVAVGRYGIRSRDSIYSKELAKDYSKNKLIFKNTLTIGMGSVQIDIGILSTDETYSVSPAYHTYRINNINPNYLRYCLECRNQDMFVRYVKKGSRQGKTIDLSRWLTYEIPVYSIEDQEKIVDKIDRVQGIIDASEKQLVKLDELVKSRFVEMFGDPLTKTKYPKRQISDLGIVGTGNTPSMRVSEYYESEDIPFIKPGDIAESGVTIVSNADTAYISESARKAARIMPYNTVMVTCIGTIGKVGIVQRESACNQQINYIIPNALINSMYLAQCLSFYKPVLEEMANAPVVPIINKTQFSTVALPVPPLELQNCFAAFVAEVDKSKFRIQKSLSVGRKLWTMAQIDAIINMDFSTQRSL